jgi:D-erythritol 1-phosphate dehydrogenase
MTDLGTVDLLVIGGGVNGAGIARDAVGRGLSVVLCEKGDLAEGTSSRSGKLVHGGLRYLEYYEFRLVREALIEREVLLEAAPHIIWPMRFVLPHSPEQRPAWMLWLGLFLYDHLGGRKRLPGCRRINLRAAPEGHIIRNEFRIAFEYSDCWVDDARLVVLNALDARQRGATVLTRTAAKSARRVDGFWEINLGEDGNAAGTSYRLLARAIVNAAGPWVENVIGQVARLNSRRRVRLVKGSHIVVKKFWDGPHAYLFQNDDKRVIFINPYEDDLCLIGTTDVAYTGAAEDVAIDDTEIDYLLAAVNRYVTHELRRADVQYVYSGVRPLYDDNAANPSAVTRDYVFDTDGVARAAPVGVRRQDHDLSQAGRACDGRIGRGLPAHGRRLDGARAAARRRSSGQRFQPLSRHDPAAPFLAARTAGAALCPPLWNAYRRRSWQRRLARRSRPAFRRAALRAGGPLSARDRMGADCRRHPAPPNKTRGASRSGGAR